MIHSWQFMTKTHSWFIYGSLMVIRDLKTNYFTLHQVLYYLLPITLKNVLNT